MVYRTKQFIVIRAFSQYMTVRFRRAEGSMSRRTSGFERAPDMVTAQSQSQSRQGRLHVA